jgi:hypothetical protein
MAKNVTYRTIDPVGVKIDPPRSAQQAIDITPTWQGVVPLLIIGIENGSTSARAELYRMAKLADAYVASQKDK